MCLNYPASSLRPFTSLAILAACLTSLPIIWTGITRSPPMPSKAEAV